MSLPEPVPGLQQPASGPLLDRFGRRHTYLRVSVTDRCNFRCTYCMPFEGLKWLPHEQVLSFEEITRIVTVLARSGIERVRLTGGEPTVRRGIERLVAMLAQVPGLRDVSMTTNGHLFGQKAQALAEAGLRRVNVSLDTLDPDQFREITRGGDLGRVLRGIDAAREAGLRPIKINAVVVAGQNDEQLLPLVEHFAPHADDTVLRFIEVMPFGELRRTHLPSAEMRRRLARHFTLQPDQACGGGPAVGWRILENGLRLGFISPLTEHFCASCNRLRLAADGHLRTCLSREPRPSLRDLLRQGADDEALEREIRARLWQKVAGHEAHLEDGKPFEGVMTRVGG